jgi:hypothetical protein
MRVRLVAACVLAALCLAPAAGAAAPRVIMVTGPNLEKPVFLSDQWENLDLMLAFQAGRELDEGRVVDPKELRGRPYFELWLYWGNSQWEPYVREGRLAELRTEQANQSGRFYPAFGRRDAVMSLDSPGSRKATTKLLNILARHGIPTRLKVPPLPSREDPSASSTWPWVVGGAVAALAAAGAAARWRLRRRPAI